MKKSNIAFYGICLLAGIFNPYAITGGLANVVYSGTAITIAIIACVLVKNKYERISN